VQDFAPYRKPKAWGTPLVLGVPKNTTQVSFSLLNSNLVQPTLCSSRALPPCAPRTHVLQPRPPPHPTAHCPPEPSPDPYPAAGAQPLTSVRSSRAGSRVVAMESRCRPAVPGLGKAGSGFLTLSSAACSSRRSNSFARGKRSFRETIQGRCATRSAATCAGVCPGSTRPQAPPGPLQPSRRAPPRHCPFRHQLSPPLPSGSPVPQVLSRHAPLIAPLPARPSPNSRPVGQHSVHTLGPASCGMFLSGHAPLGTPRWTCPVGHAPLDTPHWTRPVGLALLDTPLWTRPTGHAPLDLPCWTRPFGHAPLDTPPRPVPSCPAPTRHVTSFW
jgi:hypothetical protein